MSKNDVITLDLHTIPFPLKDKETLGKLLIKVVLTYFPTLAFSYFQPKYLAFELIARS